MYEMCHSLATINCHEGFVYEAYHILVSIDCNARFSVYEHAPLASVSLLGGLVFVGATVLPVLLCLR